MRTASRPSARPPGFAAIVTGSPASRARVSFGDPAGSTPTTRAPRRDALDRRRDARAQSAAADRHEHELDIRHVLADFEADRTLARDDRAIVERRHERGAFAGADFHALSPCDPRSSCPRGSRARRAAPRLHASRASPFVGITTVERAPNSFAASATACP